MPLSSDEVGRLPAAVTMKQASDALGISLDVLYHLARTGEFPVVRLGRRLVVPKIALLQLLGMAEETTSNPESA